MSILQPLLVKADLNMGNADALTIAQQHGPELLNYVVAIAIGLLGTIIALLLWAVKREVSITNTMLQLFRKEVADDVQLLRDNQTIMWSQISDTKKRMSLAEADIAVIKNSCKIYHGVDRRHDIQPKAYNED